MNTPTAAASDTPISLSPEQCKERAPREVPGGPFLACRGEGTNGTNVGATYDYIVVNDMSTAEITFSNGKKELLPASCTLVWVLPGSLKYRD